MIALQATPPEPQPRQFERGRTATRRRVARTRRRGYVALLRVGAVAAFIVVPLMIYVMLTANLTTLNYKLARVQTEKNALLAETMRQEDRIAKLESRERLAQVAAHLHMHEPGMYAVVAVPSTPRPPAPSPGVAFLGAMNQWLAAASGADPR
jgi:cell division protein FtsL